MEIDVTDQVSFDNPDDECLPITKCVCGAKFRAWSEFNISIYSDDPYPCPKCGRKLYFRNSIRVMEVKE